MKKPQGVLLYPGVVLRSNGMLIMPSIPKSKTSSSFLSRIDVSPSRKLASPNRTKGK